MKKLGLLLIVGACSCSLKAQPSLGQQIKEARLEMLKATVEFLAKDTVQFRNTKKPSCTNCTTFDLIKQFINDNNLKNVQKAVDKIIAKARIDTSHTWKEGLNNFKTEIDSTFFFYNAAKATDRSYRKKNKFKPVYEKYQEQMNAIIDKVKEPAPAAPAATANTDTGTSDKDQGQESDKQKEITAVNINTSPENKAPLVTPLFLYIVIGALLILCFLLFQQMNKNKKEMGYLKSRLKGLEDELQLKNDAASSQKKEILTLREDLESLSQANQNLEILADKLRKAAQTEKTASLTATDPPPVQQEPVRNAKPTPKQPVIVKKYAYSTDGGDGFLESGLLEEPNNETIFEITFTSPEVASFGITGNATVQQYALSNIDYFLRKTCQYDAFPSQTDTRINTVTPGKLRKEGNKWLIASAAKISFS